MNSRARSIDVIRGMLLSEASAVAGDEAVRTEVKDEFDTDRLKLRVFVGERSTVTTFEWIDADHVSTDDAVRGKILRQIRDALADLQHDT